MTDQVQTPATPATTDQPRLYCGKYKTVEELEAAHNNSAKLYQEKQDLERKAKELELKFEESRKVPDSYQLDEKVSLPESEKTELTALARQAGMTQDQFSKYVLQLAERRKAEQDELAKSKVERGDKLKQVEEYIAKEYPSELKDLIIDRAIRDKSAFEAIMKHREQRLNTSIPGAGAVTVAGGFKQVTDEDVRKLAHDAFFKYPNDPVAKKRHLDAVQQMARQKEAMKRY